MTVVVIVNAKNKKIMLRIITIVMTLIMAHINQKSGLAKPFSSTLQISFHLIFRTTPKFFFIKQMRKSRPGVFKTLLKITQQ